MLWFFSEIVQDDKIINQSTNVDEIINEYDTDNKNDKNDTDYGNDIYNEDNENEVNVDNFECDEYFDRDIHTSNIRIIADSYEYFTVESNKFRKFWKYYITEI